MKSYFLPLAILVSACGVESTEDPTIPSQVEEAQQPEQLSNVDFILDVGHLKASGDFEFTSSLVRTTRAISLTHLQVGAFMVDLGDHDPELLRVHFRSDYQEWVSYDEILSPAYHSREECEAESSYCEPLDFVQGDSGLIDSNEGYVGIRNIYCSTSGESYGYKVEAWVETLDTYPPTAVSEVEELDIRCEISREEG